MRKCYEIYGSMDSVDRIINEEEGSFTFCWGKKLLINCLHTGNNTWYYKTVPASPAEWDYTYFTYRSIKNKLGGKGKQSPIKEVKFLYIFEEPKKEYPKKPSIFHCRGNNGHTWDIATYTH